MITKSGDDLFRVLRVCMSLSTASRRFVAEISIRDFLVIILAS